MVTFLKRVPSFTLPSSELTLYVETPSESYLTCARSILNDPATYPDGKVFNPARWLEPSYPTYQEPLTVYPNCQNFPAFGLGRRACAGIAFAEQSLNILVAKLAWAVTVKRPMGQDGKEIREKIEYEEVQNPRPLRFGCRIVPRDPARVAIIKDVATALPK